jgi:hypothetical protein
MLVSVERAPSALQVFSSLQDTAGHGDSSILFSSLMESLTEKIPEMKFWGCYNVKPELVNSASSFPTSLRKKWFISM